MFSLFLLFYFFINCDNWFTFWFTWDRICVISNHRFIFFMFLLFLNCLIRQVWIWSSLKNNGGISNWCFVRMSLRLAVNIRLICWLFLFRVNWNGIRRWASFWCDIIYLAIYWSLSYRWMIWPQIFIIQCLMRK